MGCGSSTEAHSPGYAEDDAEFTSEINRRKEGGRSGDRNGKAKPEQENDFFEVEEAEGQQFMAVKPWIGQIAEPTNHNEVCKDPPQE
jgi:hypothetical protein